MATKDRKAAQMIHRSAGYRPEVDGLRAVAVLAILLNHAGLPWLPGGYLGVDIFFVISGFVITRILVAELQDGSFSLLAFWRRRARRIIPALAVLLATMLPLAWFLLSPAQIEQFWPVFLGSVAFAPNIVLWIDVGYFSPEAETEPLLHLWSLGVEEQFYLVYPLILLWLWRVGPAKLRPALIGLAVASLVLAGVLAPLATRAGFYLFPPRAWELLAGGLAALSAWQPVQRRQIYVVLGSVLILLPLLTFRDSAAGLPTVLPIAGTVLCILVAGPDTWLGRGLASRPAVLIGKISFGAYLWHWPLLAFLRIQMADEPALATKLGLMVIALVLGWASWRFIESPFRRSDRPLFPRLGIGAGLSTLATLAVIGSLGWLAETRGLRNLTWPGVSPAEFAAMGANRETLVGSNVCHLASERASSADFIAGWNCPAVDVPGASGWPVALYGDSHAADFGSVLRVTGRNPMQITAYSCSVVPSQMRGNCREMADLIRARAKADGISTLILVNRWKGLERSPEAQVELEIWWGEVFDTIILVGPLPSFENLKERHLRWPREELETVAPSLEDAKLFAQSRERVSGSQVRVIDPVPLFCGDRPNCSVFGQGLLMGDESGHLTKEGKQIYADALEASGVLEEISP